MDMNPLYFYVPNSELHQFFKKEKLQWSEVVAVRKAHSGNFTSWILTTYLHLKQAGIPCQVIARMPNEGIVIADRDTLGNKYPYLGKVLLVCPKGDREFHPSASIHVVHNIYECKDERNSLWYPYYIPHWPQPGLIPRLKERADRIENIAFIGSRSNLVPELSSQKWSDSLKAIGCQWHPVLSPSKWNDYSNIDIILAIRRLTAATWFIKPASKLVNAWRAGVPAILPPESAFCAIRRSKLDFLEISSLDEALEAIKQLKNNPNLYLSMIENGFERAQEFNEEKISEHWITFFSKYVVSEYEKSQAMSELERRASFVKRYFRLKLDRMQDRLGLTEKILLR